MLKCIIVEDQPPAQRILKRYITDTANLELAATFSDAINASEYLEKENIDLIFLDIHLPKISGIDFLKSSPNHPWIILTTAFSEYALESYHFNVADYILKPFSFERFTKAVQKVKQIVTFKDFRNQSITFKTGHEYIKVNTCDILFVKSDSDYTEVVTNSKTYISSEPLKIWLQKLGEVFCQIHKSYILNTDHLDKLITNKVLLSNNSELPIGRAYKKRFVKDFIKS